MYVERQRAKSVIKHFHVFLLIIFPALLTAAELLMVRDDNCPWCAVWDEEIGPIYQKTPEGKFAPLTHVDLVESIYDIRILQSVIYTPTFILIENGVEIARLEGYPGEDFFWTLLEEMLTENTDYKEIIK